jgi:hypothetical protein
MTRRATLRSIRLDLLARAPAFFIDAIRVLVRSTMRAWAGTIHCPPIAGRHRI